MFEVFQEFVEVLGSGASFGVRLALLPLDGIGQTPCQQLGGRGPPGVLSGVVGLHTSSWEAGKEEEGKEEEGKEGGGRVLV